MAAVIYPITIEEGVAFSLPLKWKQPNGDAVNMTGMTVASQIRSHELVKLLDFTVVVVPLTGQIMLSLTDEQTKAFAALCDETAVYDIEISQGGQVIRRLMKGIVTIDRQVTEEEVI